MTLDDLFINEETVSSCSVCKEYKKVNDFYFMPTPEELDYIKANYQISHGYCEPCLIKYMADNGMPMSEEDLLSLRSNNES